MTERRRNYRKPENSKVSQTDRRRYSFIINDPENDDEQFNKIVFYGSSWRSEREE